MRISAISVGAALLFIALCTYSALGINNYPPLIQGENGLMGYVAKVAYSIPGVVYLFYIVKNWRRETQHG